MRKQVSSEEVIERMRSDIKLELKGVDSKGQRGVTVAFKLSYAGSSPQGLFRSGAIAKFARGHRHGYHSDSARERAAAMFYDVYHSVPRDMHAIAQQIQARDTHYEDVGKAILAANLGTPPTAR